jgi:hypothetical protein
MQTVAIDDSSGVHGRSVGMPFIQEKYNTDILAMPSAYGAL